MRVSVIVRVGLGLIRVGDGVGVSLTNRGVAVMVDRVEVQFGVGEVGCAFEQELIFAVRIIKITL